MIYWFDANYFRTYSIHTEGVEERQYQQHLYNAQEYDLVNLIGKSLKEHLQDAYLNSTATPYEQYLQPYFKTYLLNDVELKLCDFLTYRNTSKGVQQFNQTDSTNADYSNIFVLKDTFKTYKENAKTTICKYIHDNILEFPLYGYDECVGCYNEDSRTDVYFP